MPAARAAAARVPAARPGRAARAPTCRSSTLPVPPARPYRRWRALTWRPPCRSATSCCAAARGGGEDDAHAVVPSEEAAGESGRRQALVDADPVATLRLSAFAKQQVEAAAGVHGAALAAALSAMDASLAGQLRAMLDSAA